jgi:hypothetical protein
MADDTLLPLGIGLLGISAMAGFMAFRPWPVTSGGTPIGPGAYVVETLQGSPPAASAPPDRQADITVIEGGIMALVIIWAASKIAGLLSPLVAGGGDNAAAGESEGEGDGEGDTEPAEPAEPVEPVEPILPEIGIPAV